MTSDVRKTPSRSGQLRQTIVALLVSAAMLAAAAISCTEVVVVTVEVEVTREVPVTRIVEVTREVEVVRQLTRETVVTRAAVDACLGFGELLLTYAGSFDQSSGLPEMTPEEVGLLWIPIIANVYASRDAELITALNNMIASPLSGPVADFESSMIDLASTCGRFVDW